MPTKSKIAFWNRFLAVFFVFLFSPAVFLMVYAQEPTETVLGDWQGNIEAPGIKIPVVVHFLLEGNTLTGLMDSPSQNAFGLKIADIKIPDGKLLFTVPQINGSYQGTFSDDKSSLAGTWSQGGTTIPLNFSKAETGAIPLPKRPQTPELPFPYVSQDVTFQSRGPGVVLAGTLTHPNKGGQFPAFVLLSGSGLQDRDHTVAGHKTYLVLADFLTRKGYAVLRYDDRGFGLSGGDASLSSLEALTGDALGAFDYLAGHSKIDVGMIGYIGISQGGMIAVRASALERYVASLILLSSPLRGYKDVTVYQAGALALASGESEDVAKTRAVMQQVIMDILAADQLMEKISASLQTYLTSVGFTPDKATAQIRVLLSPPYYTFVNYSPAEDIERTSIPVLAIYGGLDLQVSAKDNTNIINELNETREEKIQTVTFECLNHLLQTAEDGLPAEYYKIEETLSALVLEAVSDWLEQENAEK